MLTVALRDDRRTKSMKILIVDHEKVNRANLADKLAGTDTS